MRFSIGIRTVTRVQNYLRGTLSRLVETGALEHPDVIGLHVSHGEGITPNENGCRALLNAAEDCPDWVLFLEDDVDMLDDIVGSMQRWLAEFATDDVLAYPMCCFYAASMNARRREGFWDMPLEKYYGSQAILMRPHDAINFAHWLNLFVREHLTDPKSGVSFDLKLTQWHHLVRPHVGYLRTPAPCFFDHTGEFSAIGPPGSWERVGRVEGFPGRRWRFAAERGTYEVS